MMTARRARIQQAQAERQQLQTKVDALSKEIAELRLAEERDEHPCSCVKLNRDVEIYDMGEQERRGRVPLSVGGFVADTLTARKDCQECGGTGKPAPNHRHPADQFKPDTCPVCRSMQRNID